MKRLGLTALCAALAIGAITVAALPAHADGIGASGNAALVRGGAALPQFSGNFPIALGPLDTSPATGTNLEISLTSPDHSVLRFLFSPRTVSGETASFGPGPSGTYVGLAWNVFDNDRLFGSFAVAGAMNRPVIDDPTKRLYGPLFSVHSTFQLGYELGSEQSLTLALDHATPAAPASGDRSAFGDYLRLGYGLHF